MNKDTREKLEALALKKEPELVRAYLKAIDQVQSLAQMTLIKAAIDEGRGDDILGILQMTPDMFAPLDDAMRRAFIAGGVYQLASLPKKTLDPSGARLVIAFKGNHPRATEFILTQSSRLVTDILEEQKEMIRETIRDNVGRKSSPQIALDIVGRVGKGGKRTGGLIGLNRPQSRTFQRYKIGLRSGDPEVLEAYLQSKSRDKRLDGAVERALKAGKGLSQSEVDRRMVGVRNKMLRRRGETIARTETRAALGAGRREAVAQMIDRGVISSDQVTRSWDATGDGRTRPMHQQMESGEPVPWGVPFIAPDGSRLMGPGDSGLGASAEMVINCRCYEQIKIDYLARFRR